MNKKVIIIMVLILVLSFGNIYAQTTEEQAAKDLNEIQMLQGDGNNLNLAGELTRAEGATFIVRLLGKEEEVIANKIDYLAVNFSDVYGSDWFSPYVGYCVEQGIIDGYSDGTFRAMDKLSEQAFVKMVLEAMNYNYGVDYSWSETLSYAYSKGILEDEAYKDMVSSSDPYTRGEVVQLLHHVLSQKNADGSKVMVDTLIEDEVLTRVEAINYGFIIDPVIMAVDDFEQNNGYTFAVLLNEIPKPLTSENIIVKEKNSDTIVEVSRVYEADIQRMYYITVNDQIPDIEYSLILTNIEDLQGNILEDYTYDFFGYRGSDYDSAYFRLARAELKSVDLLDLTFTQPIDISKISPDDLLIMRDGSPFIGGSDNNMALTVDESNPYICHVEFLNAPFTFEDTFEVVVSKDVKSLYGANIKDGEDDSARFTSSVFEEAAFAFSQSILESEKSLVLVFNKNINEKIAEQVFSYYITENDNALIILKAEVIKSGSYANKAVRLTMEKALTSNGIYSLLINQAYDTTRSEEIIEEEMTIIAKTVEKPDLSIMSVKTTAANRIEIVLEDYLDETAAELTSNYTIKDVSAGSISRTPSKVYYDKYASLPTLVLEFASKTIFNDGESYELTISKNMKLDSGLSLKKDAKKTFVDNKDLYTDTVIKKAMYIGNNIVIIKGNTEFALDIPNVLNSNYKLETIVGESVNSIEPIGVEYFNEHIIILRFESIDSSLEYSLIVNQIKTGFGELIDTDNEEIELIIEELK